MNLPENEKPAAMSPVTGFGPNDPQPTGEIPGIEKVDEDASLRAEENLPETAAENKWEQNDDIQQVGSEVTDGEAG